jgi:hypothetical protein
MLRLARIASTAALMAAAVSLVISAAASSAATDPGLRHRVLRPSPPQAKAEYGASLATSGEWAVVGAPAYGSPRQGMVDVYTDATGPWTIAQRLTSPTPRANGEFGTDVAVSGTTIAATDFNPHRGVVSVDVFELEGGAWVETQTLVPGAGSQYATVAIDGPLMVIGNSNYVSPTPAADVYRWSGSEWTLEAHLTKPNDSSFGSVVATDGSEVFVTAPYNGAVFVFQQTAGTWTQVQKLVPAEAQRGHDFGDAAAVSGRVLVVGSAYTVPGAPVPGAAFVFRRTVTGPRWRFDGTLGPPSTVQEPAGDFGVVLATDAKMIAVGFPTQGQDLGAVYLFSHATGSWTQTDEIDDPNGDSGLFGYQVAISHHHLLASRPIDNGGRVDAYRGNLIE